MEGKLTTRMSVKENLISTNGIHSVSIIAVATLLYVIGRIFYTSALYSSSSVITNIIDAKTIFPDGNWSRNLIEKRIICETSLTKNNTCIPWSQSTKLFYSCSSRSLRVFVSKYILLNNFCNNFTIL